MTEHLVTRGVSIGGSESACSTPDVARRRSFFDFALTVVISLPMKYFLSENEREAFGPSRQAPAGDWIIQPAARGADRVPILFYISGYR